MTPIEFCDARIKEWEAKLKQASEQTDFKGFEHADRELKNYQRMREIERAKLGKEEAV
jgi:hypothetical protein